MTMTASRTAHSATQWALAPRVHEAAECLAGAVPRYAARAPGRLDVFGGMSSFAGAHHVQMTCGDSAVAVAALTGDDSIVAVDHAATEGNGHARAGIPWSAIPAGQSSGAVAAAVRANAAHALSPHMLAAVGAVVELFRSAEAGARRPGVGVSFDSSGGDPHDECHAMALSATVAIAAARAAGVALDGRRLTSLCQTVASAWIGRPCSRGDATCAASAEPRTLLQSEGETGEVGQMLRLNDAVRIVGLAGIPRPTEAFDRYLRARTAAMMGLALIDRIIRHESPEDGDSQRRLARVTLTDYVERFRDRLPTKMKGQDFLDRFGETGDPLTRVDPRQLYKIRSRTEHHIYEHARSRQFVECVSRAMRTNDRFALLDAGELMFASHWSYGQRCGLGNVMADQVVSAVRKHGPSRDLFGAKMTGLGCGGVVCVLMRNSASAAAALDAALAEHKQASGCALRRLTDSTPGALLTGAEEV